VEDEVMPSKKNLFLTPLSEYCADCDRALFEPRIWSVCKKCFLKKHPELKDHPEFKKIDQVAIERANKLRKRLPDS